MPEPPASSAPLQLTVKSAVVVVAGNALTLLDGAPTSMVLLQSGVSSGASVSNTMVASASIFVPVARDDFGSTKYIAKPWPTFPSVSGGRKPSNTPVGASRVAGSSEVNVQVMRPVA